MAAFLFLITDDTDIYTIIIHYLCSPKSYKSETEVISVEGLSVEFNATPLFEDVSYVINKKDRIALVGKNGAGNLNKEVTANYVPAAAVKRRSQALSGITGCKGSAGGIASQL